MLFFLFLL